MGRGETGRHLSNNALYVGTIYLRITTSKIKLYIENDGREGGQAFPGAQIKRINYGRHFYHPNLL